MAEMERLKIAERTQRGKQARFAAGKYNVGSHAPFGYSWLDPNGKDRLVENPTTAPVVRRIIEEIASGGSARQLSRRLTEEGVPSRMADLEYWCRVQAQNLQQLTYDQKRLALRALNVEANVWATDHDPRFTVTLQLDGLVRDAASDPRLDDDVDPAEVRVDDCTRRGCARRGGRRGGRL